MAMKKISTIFLQAAVVLLGAGVLALMLWVPPHEGRNAAATLFATYFQDPFLAYAYIGAVPFFAALFQAFKVLGYVRRDEVFSPPTLKALRFIRYCALATAGIVAGAVIYIRITAGGRDDPAGFVVPGSFAVFVSLAAAAAASVIETILKKAAEMKKDAG